MGDPFAKVRSGEPLRIPASAYNTMVDAAKDFSARKNSGVAGSAKPAQANLVRVKNISGSDAARFNVLGIEGTVFDPANATEQFKNSVALAGTTPSAANHSNGRFLICAEPIANNAFGFAVASGLCQVKINVDDESHNFADVTDGDIAQLTSVEAGPVVIIWKEAGTGPDKWAIVRFGGSGGGGGGFTVAWYKVIDVPYYENPENPNQQMGKAYYTLRPVGTTFPSFSPNTGTDYTANTSYVSFADDDGNENVYKCLENITDATDADSPRNAPAKWHKEEETRIEHNYGFDGMDIRLFVPWFNRDQIVPVISRVLAGGATRYYIWGVFTYCGSDQDASIRWNQEQKRAMAVFK